MTSSRLQGFRGPLGLCGLTLWIACCSQAPPPKKAVSVGGAVEGLVAPLAPGDAQLIGAGDIADCTPAHPIALDTAALVAKFPAATVFTAGDNAYEHGAAEELAGCYDKVWGSFKGRTRPALGNHDYGIYLKPPRNDAGPYFDYFGANAGPRGDGYYSYDLGSWHILALNSMAGQPGAPTMEAQVAWLKKDLEANAKACTLAYWHHPLWSSGPHGRQAGDPGRKTRALWDVLYEHHADVVLNGHDHDYERFKPLDPAGVPTPRGIRQFVVGTGGGEAYTPGPADPRSDALPPQDFGVLLLTLHPKSYEWHFLKRDGTVGDSSSAPQECH